LFGCGALSEAALALRRHPCAHAAPAHHPTTPSLTPLLQAFGVAKVGRANKAIQRKLDIGHRGDHAPVADRKPVTPPPVVVVVMGPPGSGKTTLIKVRSGAARAARSAGPA
jgi:hypothetical protein